MCKACVRISGRGRKVPNTLHNVHPSSMGMAETSFLWPLGVVLVNWGLVGGAFLVFLGSSVPALAEPFFSPGWFHLGFSFFSFPCSERSGKNNETKEPCV
jgi:hypothetical protein